MYEWGTFLGTYFRKIDNIKNYHHFSFSKGSTLVTMKKFLNSDEVSQDLEKNHINLDALDLNALPCQLPNALP